MRPRTMCTAVLLTSVVLFQLVPAASSLQLSIFFFSFFLGVLHGVVDNSEGNFPQGNHCKNI